MSLKSSGAISTEDIARELGKEGQTLSFNQQDVLKLAGKSSGQQVVLPNDFYGKSFSSGGNPGEESGNIVTEKFVDFTDFKARIGSILQKYSNNLSTVNIEFEDGGVSCTSPSKMFPTSITHSPNMLILPKVETLKEAFSGCNLVYISKNILTKVKKNCKIDYIFEYCTSLKKVPILLGVENMYFYSNLFYGVYNLDIDFDTAKFYIELKLENIVPSKLLIWFSPNNEEHIRLFQNLLNSKTNVKMTSPFKGNEMVKNLDFMLDMKNLSSLSADRLFEESSIESADLYVVKEILSNKSSAIRMFCRCTKLKNFTNKKNVTDWYPSSLKSPSEMFLSCVNLEYIDSDIVMKSLFDKVGNPFDFDRVFSECEEYKGTIPEYWSKATPKYHTDYAADCTKAKNYKSVPDDWK